MIRYVDVYNPPVKQATIYYKFLYTLLKERKPYQNISHKIMPTYRNHVKFIKSRPYKGWYVIQDGEELVGGIYLGNENNVGIFIKEGYQQMGYGKKAVNFICEKFSHIRTINANIAPTNSESLVFFINSGFTYGGCVNEQDKITQYMYKTINPFYVPEQVL